MWAWLKDRAAEPSTWRGVGSLLVAAGLASVGSVEALVTVGVAVMGAVDMIRRGG